MALVRILLCCWSLLLVPLVSAETITLGAEDAWYPYSGEVDGQAQGFTVDMVRAAFAAVGIEVKYLPLPYARCMKLVKDGKLLGCFNTSRTSLLEQDYLWHKKPMFSSRILIYARADHPRRDMRVVDLEGKRVLVTNGYEYGDAFDNNQSVVRDASKDDLSVLRKLAARRADYALVFEKAFANLVRQNKADFDGRFVAVGVVETMHLYTVFSKTFPESPRYVELLDRGMSIISRNGRLREIEKQWE
jgi:polar amino acid transport system substrate-binding protein